jgi:hypothetical protein
VIFISNSWDALITSHGARCRKITKCSLFVWDPSCTVHQSLMIRSKTDFVEWHIGMAVGDSYLVKLVCVGRRFIKEKIRIKAFCDILNNFGRRAVKATALLFPLLGINNLLFIYNPGGDYKRTFVILNTVFQSTQVGSFSCDLYSTQLLLHWLAVFSNEFAWVSFIVMMRYLK